MSRRTRQGRAHAARPNLSLEQLESRNMMAAGTPSSASLPIAELIDSGTDNKSQPSILSASAGRNSRTSTTAVRHAPAPSPVQSTAVRSIDGTGNNIANPEWGSTGEQLLRAAASQYADGISAPAGADRPSAREISNALNAHGDADTPNNRNLTAFICIWGQFLDHDIDLTEPPETDREAFPIAVPTSDEIFDPDGSGGDVIRFNRSRYDEITGTDVDNPREQINQITAWIDASMVYGSDQATAPSAKRSARLSPTSSIASATATASGISARSRAASSPSWSAPRSPASSSATPPRRTCNRTFSLSAPKLPARFSKTPMATAATTAAKRASAGSRSSCSTTRAK